MQIVVGVVWKLDDLFLLFLFFSVVSFSLNQLDTVDTDTISHRIQQTPQHNIIFSISRMQRRKYLSVSTIWEWQRQQKWKYNAIFPSIFFRSQLGFSFSLSSSLFHLDQKNSFIAGLFFLLENRSDFTCSAKNVLKNHFCSI